MGHRSLGLGLAFQGPNRSVHGGVLQRFDPAEAVGTCLAHELDEEGAIFRIGQGGSAKLKHFRSLSGNVFWRHPVLRSVGHAQERGKSLPGWPIWGINLSFCAQIAPHNREGLCGLVQVQRPEALLVGRHRGPEQLILRLEHHRDVVCGHLQALPQRQTWLFVHAAVDRSL